MPTRAERDTVAKLMLMVANAFDENRKEQAIEAYAADEMRPEFSLAELRPTANEAMKDAQEMLASWGRVKA
jgi:hypothetical protein